MATGAMSVHTERRPTSIRRPLAGQYAGARRGSVAVALANRMASPLWALLEDAESPSRHRLRGEARASRRGCEKRRRRRNMAANGHETGSGKPAPAIGALKLAYRFGPVPRIGYRPPSNRSHQQAESPMHRADQRTACITGGVHDDPEVVWPLALRLLVSGTDIAGPRWSDQHLRKAQRQLPFQPARPFATPLPCGAAPARRSASASQPSASAMTASPAHHRRAREMCSTRGHPSSAQSASHADGCRPLSANSEKARENVASRKPAGTAPADAGKPPSLKTLDQAARSNDRTRPWL